MLSIRLTLIVLLGALALLVLVIEMVRRRALAERYSLLWLAAAIVVVSLAALRPLLDRLAMFMGFSYAPSLLFLAGFGALLMILLYLSTVITTLTRQNRITAQRMGLLQARVEELEREKSDKATAKS